MKIISRKINRAYYGTIGSQNNKEVIEMDTKTYLDGELKRLYDRMKVLDPESKEYAAVEEAYLKMQAQKLEIEKHEASKAQTEKQMKVDRNHRIVGYVIDGAKVLITAGITIGGSILAWQIEDKGVVPFGFGKKFVDKLTKY